ncbi:hypothetical protein DWV75_04060 [Ruminococcus sp. AF12-5]|jgi:hypothetical protein|nr:hypothetical protein DWV75_04060 [Ruminococcus sp. AF12-5]
MKKRKTVQEPVEIDVLQKKKDELAQFVERYNSAVAVVTGTVSNLESINASIDEKIKEIEEYQEELVKTKNGLGDTKMKNEQVIKNFKALVGA